MRKYEVKKSNPIRNEIEADKKIFDEPKMCDVAEWIHSKATFARLVSEDESFAENFNFANFNLIFDAIRTIMSLS